MDKQKLLLVGYRAYGDWVYTAPVLPYLFEKYDVYAEMNFKGQELFHDDPRFTEKNYFYFEQYPVEEFSTRMAEREKELIERIKPDCILNLNGSLELACIARREQPEFFSPVGHRRVIFGSNGFYDAVFDRCGIPIPNPLNLEGLWYPPEIIKWAEEWSRVNADKFVIMMCIHGSSIHKKFRNWREVTLAILDRYPEAVIYLIGDDGRVMGDFKHERVRPAFFPTLPFKQVALMTKYVDLVIGPETGVMVAAGMHGTPKIMACSASSVWQTTQYQKNDFSFQLPVPCSPCHLSVFSLDDCETVVEDQGEKVPACVKEFPVNQILERTDYVFRHLRRKLS